MIDQYQAFANTLARCRRVLVTTHVRPDGDAIGSTAALALGLRQKGLEATVLLLSRVPSKYAFVYRDAGITPVESFERWPESLRIDDFDAAIVVDTGTWSQLPGLRETLENWARPKIVLDHHKTQETWADLKLVVPEAAAAGELIAELLQFWKVQVDTAIATALYVALLSDTGWFQFSNTRPFTLRLAAQLMEAGVDTDRLNILLNQSERAERVFLQTRALNSLELLAGGKVALMTLGREDFAAAGAGVPATENLINIPLQIGSVEVSVLAVDPPDGAPIRVSLRSKGGVDCARFAERFGGGGHSRAAGLKIATQLGAGGVRGAVQPVINALLSGISP